MGDLITSEQVIEMGKRWALRTMSLSEILSYLEPEKRLEALEKILSNYTVEERLRGIEPEEIRAYLKRLEEGQQ